jgi:hypothetical protein
MMVIVFSSLYDKHLYILVCRYIYFLAIILKSEGALCSILETKIFLQNVLHFAERREYLSKKSYKTISTVATN